VIEEQTGVVIGFWNWEPAVSLGTLLGTTSGRLATISVPLELVLIPALLVLAVVVGFWPAVSAYRTDVAKSLGK
jgi:putative ABC transport system permease protein